MLQQLDRTDNIRREFCSLITQERRAELGQFMTPSSVARFMAAMFSTSSHKSCRLLDAGAGMGALSCAFLDRWLAEDFRFHSVDVTAYEIDEKLAHVLNQQLAEYSGATCNVITEDYIERASTNKRINSGFTHAILNPPYKKINSASAHRLALRRVGIETVNLYSAFVALAVTQLAPGGQIVAITPRSFCNGPYYRSFRNFILKHTALKKIHLFEARNKAFKDDEVLQENVIIYLERGGQQGKVTVSTSTDDSFSDLKTYEYPFDRIVSPTDPEQFIRIPTSPQKNTIELHAGIRYTLADLGIKVSTGPVVDFRLKDYLRNIPQSGAVPLLYPFHFNGDEITWPVLNYKKPNAIEHNEKTERWLYPNGFYCVVKRFSSKEEKRRIMAGVVNPEILGNVPMLGFENHLNLFHENKKGLSEALAKGLAAFLNTNIVDEYFRCFNGHTQVNATDLKLIKYPSRDILIQLGEWVMQQKQLTQGMVEEKLEKFTR